MRSIHLYFEEFGYLKNYFLTILTVTILSFSVYFFLDESTIARIGDEDHLFEWLTSLNFLVCSMIFLRLFFKGKNILFLLLSVVFFFGFGEEISWGQRIFGFQTPEQLYALNMQREFNFHNTMTWEINFLYKVFTLLFGIVLPLCVFHVKKLGLTARKMKIPVPPLTLGIFFLIDWLIFKFFLDFVLQKGFTPKYYFALTEIFEFVSSFIMLTIVLYFYQIRKILTDGQDIKEYLVSGKKENEKLKIPNLKPVWLSKIITPSIR